MWLSIMAFGYAEPIETEEINSKEQSTVPVLYSGKDEQATLLRTAKASGQSADQLQAITTIDLVGSSSIQLRYREAEQWNHTPVETCTRAAVSNAHIRNLTQKADNYLNYYDLSKASSTLKKAEDIVVCLQELFNADDIRQLYFLRGVLEQSKGNDIASIQAFSSAIRIKPDMKWNTLYSPDARPNFDIAKKSFVQLTAVPLDIYPKSAASSLWINGAPLLDMLDNEMPTISEGRNIIQIVGLETLTYEIEVPADTNQIELIVPSTLSVNAIDGMDNPTEQMELSLVLEPLLPVNSTLYIHNQGRVWESTIGTKQWHELDVPRTAELRLNAKQITAQSFFWTGTVITGASLGIGIRNYSKGYSAYGQAQESNSWEDYETHAQSLEEQRGQYRASLMGVGIGLGLSALSYQWAF